MIIKKRNNLHPFPCSNYTYMNRCSFQIFCLSVKVKKDSSAQKSCTRHPLYTYHNSILSDSVYLIAVVNSQMRFCPPWIGSEFNGSVEMAKVELMEVQERMRISV